MAAYLHSAGYDVVPVNPGVDEIAGMKTYARVADVAGGVDLAIVYRRSEEVLPHLEEIAAKGVAALWLPPGVATPEIANPFSKVPTRGVSATVKLNREDWGLVWNMPVGDGLMVSKEIGIELDVEYTKDEGKVTAQAPAKK